MSGALYLQPILSTPQQAPHAEHPVPGTLSQSPPTPAAHPIRVTAGTPWVGKVGRGLADINGGLSPGQAVCCSDGQHCCPQGTVCDLERSTCTSERSLASLPKGEDRPGG